MCDWRCWADCRLSPGVCVCAVRYVHGYAFVYNNHCVQYELLIISYLVHINSVYGFGEKEQKVKVLVL